MAESTTSPEAPSPTPGSGPVAVVLAAGASERFQGDPKALVPVGTESAVERVTRIAREGGFPTVIVVAGPHIREIDGRLRGTGVEVVENPEWHLGRTGSVQVGLRAAGAAPSVLIWPVDHPFVEVETVVDLVRAAEHDLLALWLIPTFQGRGGHPVLLRGRALRRVDELEPYAPMRLLLPAMGPEVRRVVVRDPGVLENVDTFEQYHESLEAWGLRQRER